MSIAPKAVTPAEPDVEYPETDGQPMGETHYHVIAILTLYETLAYHFRQRRMYVAADMFLYYQKGAPSKNKAPDVMVIKGVKNYPRRTFKTWEEKAIPCVIFEITSEKTKAEDQGPKKDVYEKLGVKEYFIFDPEAKYLKPPLQGFRLKGTQYVPIAFNQDGSLTCKELKLLLTPEGHLLRLTDVKTGQRLLTSDERANQEAERAEQERQRAEQEKQRAEQEKQRADGLAAEVERLRAEIEAAKQKPI